MPEAPTREKAGPRRSARMRTLWRGAGDVRRAHVHSTLYWPGSRRVKERANAVGNWASRSP